MNREAGRIEPSTLASGQRNVALSLWPLRLAHNAYRDSLACSLGLHSLPPSIEAEKATA